jgi:hypothetical protein
MVIRVGDALISETMAVTDMRTGIPPDCFPSICINIMQLSALLGNLGGDGRMDLSDLAVLDGR